MKSRSRTGRPSSGTHRLLYESSVTHSRVIYTPLYPAAQGGENENVGGGEGAGNNNALCCSVPREQTLPALLGAVGVKLSQISPESRRADHAIALQAAPTMPTGLVPTGRAHHPARG